MKIGKYLEVTGLAESWVRLYELKPILTSVLTGLISLVFIAGTIYLDHADREKRERTRLEGLDYQTQIQKLNQMETNVKQLLAFVDNQKKNLQETEDTIYSLKSEKERLKPLVETDRAVVEALFKAQEERTNANIWRERWIGFGFGVVASLLASFIWFVVSLLLTNRHNKQMQPTRQRSVD